MVVNGIQEPQRRDLRRGKRDFLVALADRRGNGTDVAGLDASARETDLPAMMAQAVGAAGQQHLRALLARHQAGQHRRLDRRPGRQQVGEFLMVPACLHGQVRQRMQDLAQGLALGQQQFETGTRLFATRQGRLHQAQAFVIVHLRPAGNLGGRPQTTFAEPVVTQGTNTYARAEHGAVSGIHRIRHQ